MCEPVVGERRTLALPSGTLVLQDDRWVAATVEFDEEVGTALSAGSVFGSSAQFSGYLAGTLLPLHTQAYLLFGLWCLAGMGAVLASRNQAKKIAQEIEGIESGGQWPGSIEGSKGYGVNSQPNNCRTFRVTYPRGESIPSRQWSSWRFSSHSARKCLYIASMRHNTSTF